MYQQRDISGHQRLGILNLAAFAGHRALEGKRTIEKEGIRYVLQQLLNTSDELLEYTNFRKPMLKDARGHISISHSHDRLAIIYNSRESTGIDIELVRDKVLNIQHKFLSERELGFAKDDVPRLITIWAAKEALYKVYGEKELEFIKNLAVEMENGDLIKGHIRLPGFEKSFLMRSEDVDNYKMVYVLEQL